MKVSEARRYLARLGASFSEGGSHTRVELNGKISFIPRHGSKELPKGTWRAILKQLGIEQE